MIELFFDKLYRYERIAEPCYIGIPVKEGELRDTGGVRVYQEGRSLPLQTKVTSRHKDGSVRFLFLRFLADLPANRKAVLRCDLHGADNDEKPSHDGETSHDDKPSHDGEISHDTGAAVVVNEDGEGITVSTRCDGDGQPFSFRVRPDGGGIFERLDAMGRTYTREQFVGPLLRDGAGRDYQVRIGGFRVVEAGPVCAILKARGSNLPENPADAPVEFELKLTAWAGKPWVEVSYRLINTTDAPLPVASLVFHLLRTTESRPAEHFVPMKVEEKLDSTGCGDSTDRQEFGDGPVFHVRGTGDLERAAEKAPVSGVRTCAGSSNYKTDFYIGRDASAVNRMVDAEWLIREANEHFGEVFYGTFFADCTDEAGGVCATVFQAQQNYPKAVQADGSGLSVMLVPEGAEPVVMQTGMSREQRFLLHFHSAEESLAEIDNRSLIYQMPDRPYLAPETHRDSGVWLDVFADKWDVGVERYLVGRADGHCRAYGMLNFGDSYDSGYTDQGRGGGNLVWCNNEYDYPHACALLYVRTGIRRFLDYNIASCSHWMDVDVCHYHPNPLYIGGQWEHTGGHCINGVMVCSHEWVEGLLDYWHLTGDERGLETALGIGDNVMRLLDSPMYAKVGEANARETGWALRTFTALYVETRDEKWLAKCGKILQDFKIWEDQYGNWLAPYTDNTVVRVGFMISVAIGSVMRYYREFPDPELKELMLRAVDDLIENSYMEKFGCFYYKELPSLNRIGANTLLLEALAIAYELTGNAEYLKPGIETFKRVTAEPVPGAVGAKRHVQDAVIVGNASSKAFAQSMIPLATYYRAASECGLL
ncbi:MAG: glycoside hydrolase family 127 protein [Muribaculum sp.]|nr:glycoside hydrolase family 127 protein [Muribaculum sp.]